MFGVILVAFVLMGCVDGKSIARQGKDECCSCIIYKNIL
jgi:hypothetical protein